MAAFTTSMPSASAESKSPEEDRWPTEATGYRLTGLIGKGAYARVYEATCPSKGDVKVAIKVIELATHEEDLDDEQADENDSKFIETMQKEAATLMMLNHDNITSCYVSFVVKEELWIVMEMCIASASDIMEKVKEFKNGFRDHAILATILRDVLLGLQYCHKDGRIHRDIKARNLLLTMDGVTKLADFGVSGAMFEGGMKKRGRDTLTGTPSWMSPEVMSKQKYNHKTDIWSLGITALELAFGKAPFQTMKPVEVMLAVTDPKRDVPTVDGQGDHDYPKSFKTFVSKCLNRDPKARPTVKELLGNSFLKKATDYSYIAEKVMQIAEPLVTKKADLALPRSLISKRVFEVTELVPDSGDAAADDDDEFRFSATIDPEDLVATVSGAKKTEQVGRFAVTTGADYESDEEETATTSAEP